MKTANPHILTINGGSSSIKFALFEAMSRSGGSSRAGLSGLDCRRRLEGERPEPGGQLSRPVTAPDHTAAVGALVDWIEESGRRAGLTAVGHRVVHGGPKYSEPQQITDEMVEELHRLSPFDPNICPKRSC